MKPTDAKPSVAAKPVVGAALKVVDNMLKEIGNAKAKGVANAKPKAVSSEKKQSSAPAAKA